MRDIVIAGLVLLFACNGPHAENSVSHAAIRNEIDKILEIQEQSYDAHTEEGNLRFATTCDDSLFYVGGDNGGFVASANIYVHDFADGYIKRPYDKQYRILENTVIVTFLTETFKRFGNDTIHFNTRGTKVFARLDKAWNMIYVTYAPLPLTYERTVKVNSTILDKYAGLYRGSNGTVDTVVVVDGKLFLGTVASAGSELIPINDSTFIGRGYFGKTIFSSNMKGSVTHNYFEFPDGQHLVFSKIK